MISNRKENGEEITDADNKIIFKGGISKKYVEVYYYESKNQSRIRLVGNTPPIVIP